jgi:hypothetical protein
LPLLVTGEQQALAELCAQCWHPKRPLDHAAAQRGAPAVGVFRIAFTVVLEKKRLAQACSDLACAERGSSISV